MFKQKKVVYTIRIRFQQIEILDFFKDNHYPDSYIKDFTIGFDDAVKRILSHEHIGIFAFKNIRYTFFNKYYRLYYQIFPDTIVILFFFDMRRSPDELRKIESKF